MMSHCTECAIALDEHNTRGSYYDHTCWNCGLKKAPRPEVHSLHRHYKGGEYLVQFVCIHSETRELMVSYTSLTYASMWVRPLKIWNELVANPNDPEKLLPRFLPIKRRSK